MVFGFGRTLKTRQVPVHRSSPFMQKGFPKRFSQSQRQSSGSQLFTFRLKAIAANSKVLLPFGENSRRLSSNVSNTFTGLAKYMPFSDLIIHNQSTEEINIEINQDDTKVIPVPANTQRVVEAWEHGGIWNINVVNKHATNATADFEIIISVWRRYPQEEELFYKKISRVFGR